MKKLLIIGFTLISLNVYTQVNYYADSIIQVCINEINPDSIRSVIMDLENFETRYMISPNRKEVANWIKNRFINIGYLNTFIDSFQTYTNYSDAYVDLDTITWQYNVIAELPGSQSQDTSVIIGGHYDSYNNYSDPLINAPGADDDASGIGAAIEIARVLKETNYNPRISIKFIAFAAEELVVYSSLSGSKDYAAKAANNNDKIKFYINNDMISYTSNPSNWQITVHSYNNSLDIADLAVDCFSNYTILAPFDENDNAIGVDSHNFFINGFKTVYFEEVDFIPYYHSEFDIVDSCNMEYCAEVTKASIAMLVITTFVNYTGIAIDEYNAIDNINVYPNPATSEITVQLTPKGQEITIEICDINGQKLIHQKLNKSKTRIDLSHLSRGIYVAKFMTNKAIIIRKIVKN